MRRNRESAAALIGTAYAGRMLIEGDRAQIGNSEKEQVWNLLVDEIDPDPLQPRKHFDDDALRELAKQIGEHGVLQPIIVERVGERYRIIVGERRWRATRLAEKTRIPCIIREMTPEQICKVQLIENIVREDLSDVDRGLAIRRLYETLKRGGQKVTWDQVGAMVGLTRARINDMVGLSSLPEPIVHLIQNGQLSGTHGIQLARLDDRPDAQLELANDAKRETRSGPYRMSVAAVRDRVNIILGTATPRAGSIRQLSPEEMDQHSKELIHGLRPDLPPGLQQSLRETAIHILRFLDTYGQTVTKTGNG